MATATEIPKPTHREVTPIKQCATCDAYLRSFTNQDRCDPCRKGKVELTTDEVLDRINALPIRERAAAFDALQEMHAKQ